ncbi:hypothetical protein CH252_18710 [Rhodococcus sp. 06-1477-1B]|nr:hypothetical protein CH252_18710 [Rhodococcus sp. 06-1477-1B]
MAVVGYFPATVVVNESTFAPIVNAEGYVFSASDTSFSSPLNITDVQGVPFPGSKLVANARGITQSFRAPAGVVEVRVKFGEAVTPMISLSAYAEVAETAASTAQGAAGAAGEARDQAVIARGAAEDAAAAAAAVGATTDAQMAAIQATPTSAFAVAQKATIGAAVTEGVADKVTAPQVSTIVKAATDKILPYPLDGSWPIFKRLNGGNPIMTQATQNPAPGALAPTTSVSLYWPWVIDARRILGSAALDEFYLIDSTDHAAHASSGFWLRTGPTELGPWTSRGRVYIDNVSGSQTETPTVFEDPTGTVKFIALYQQAGVAGANGLQTTLYATSNDCITWTRGGIAIDAPPTWPGDGHTGYATLTALGGRMYSHHLAGGGDQPTFGLSTSTDGRKWAMDPDPLLYNMDQTGDGRRVEWNTTSIVMWRGKLWWIGMLSNFVSGDATKDARLAIAPISDDLRTLLAPPKYILFPIAGSENTNYRSCRAFTARDGRIIFYYQCGNSYFAASTEV